MLNVIAIVGSSPYIVASGDFAYEPSPVSKRNLTKNAFRVAANVKGAFTVSVKDMHEQLNA